MAKRRRKLKKSIKVALVTLAGITAASIGTLFILQTNAESVTVENFVGKDKEEVEAWIEENEIAESSIAFTYDYSEKEDKNIVLSQSIKAGEILGDNEVLVIDVSKGADPDTEFTLPDFTGQKEDAIKKWFSDKKFTAVSYVYEENEEKETGDFISITPDAGTSVKRSEEVTVTLVNNEKTEVTVPDFSLYSASEIEQWANDNKINVSLAYDYSDTISEGSVISVSVNTGDVIHAGDTITVVISRGKNQEAAEESQASTVENVAAASEENTVNNQATEEINNSERLSTPEPASDNNTVTENTSSEESSTENTNVSNANACPASLYTGLYAGNTNVLGTLQSGYPGCTFYATYLNDENSNPDNNAGVYSYSSNGDGTANVSILVPQS